MRFLIRFLFLTVAILAGAQSFAQAPESAKFLDEAGQRIADIRKQLGGDVDDSSLDEFRDVVAAIGTQATALADDRAPQLAALQARLAELGPAPAKGASEAADIAAQRADLVKQGAALDAEIKRAKLLIVDAQQTGSAIIEARRAIFQARLSQRTPSPLTPTFWRDLSSNLDRDGSRLGMFRDGAVAALRDAFAPDNRAAALTGLGVGLVLILFGRRLAERGLRHLTTERMPQGRLRRSALAFAVVVSAMVFSGLGAQVIASGLDWHGAFGDMERSLAKALVGAVFFGSFVAGLGRALLSSARPSWRLPPIPDEVAERLRIFPLLFGCAVAFSVLQKQVNSLAGASLSATVAGSLLVAVVYSVLIIWALSRARAAHAADRGDDDDASAAPRRQSAWVGIGIAALWFGAIATLATAMSGYVALAQQIARQMVGLGIVAATFYLLVHLIEDLCAAAVSARAQWVQRTFGLDERVLDQFAVVCGGLFRVCALVLALLAALAPLGAGPSDLLARLAQAGSGLKIGEIELTSGEVFGALGVLALGLVAIRTLKRWLLDRYLPTTRLDPAMRSSVTTLLGYTGGVIVVALALSALGIGVERIAWVASALSVGIGFGLQAIVQNFVSGLILLVERPVKVGDWVVLGDAEGDIRRISVRATEIQMADRSTLIVPNSELITKSVRNVTLANAEGRVRIRLPVPVDSDATRVREIVRETFAAHQGVLTTPTPSVLLDGIEGGSLIFVAVAYIANPRQSGSVRSDLLFEVLARLRANRIALSSPQDIKLLRPVSFSSTSADPIATDGSAVASPQ
jgi:potassium efflux system protein